MNLKTWISMERGRTMALARAIDVPPSFISRITKGEKAIPPEHVKAIERYTGGAVTPQDMRPNDWHKYWPELSASTPASTTPTTTDRLAA